MIMYKRTKCEFSCNTLLIVVRHISLVALPYGKFFNWPKLPIINNINLNKFLDTAALLAQQYMHRIIIGKRRSAERFLRPLFRQVYERTLPLFSSFQHPPQFRQLLAFIASIIPWERQRGAQVGSNLLLSSMLHQPENYRNSSYRLVEAAGP